MFKYDDHSCKLQRALLRTYVLQEIQKIYDPEAKRPNKYI